MNPCLSSRVTLCLSLFIQLCPHVNLTRDATVCAPQLERLRAASTIAPSRPKSPRLRNTTRGSSRSSSVKSAASTQGGGDTRASQEEAKREARRQAARDAWMVQAAESGLLKRTAEFEEKRAQVSICVALIACKKRAAKVSLLRTEDRRAAGPAGRGGAEGG